MGISSALFASVSGINALSTGITVVSDNIANVNTNGFKSGKASFSDLLSQTLSGGDQLGRGTQVNNVGLDFSQGSFELSNSPTNIAIDGDGFFIVNDGSGDFYTRSGEFNIDSNGFLVNPQGHFVQGFQIVSGVQAGSDSNISFSTAQSAPSATTTLQLGINLDVRDTTGNTFQTAATVYDSLGNPVTLTFTFTKAASSGSWTWAVASTSGTTSDTGSITFNSSGTLVSPTTEPTISVTGLATGASNLSVTWDMLNSSNASNGSITGFATSSVVNTISQNGFNAGSLVKLSIDKGGIITGLFTNGQSQNLYRLSLADFTNPQGLTKLGRGIFAQSSESGAPIPGVGNSGGFGTIASNSLELSNVDLAAEFVSMITAQRGFQANTRLISTVDELMGEVVNLKR